MHEAVCALEAATARFGHQQPSMMINLLPPASSIHIAQASLLESVCALEAATELFEQREAASAALTNHLTAQHQAALDQCATELLISRSQCSAMQKQVGNAAVSVTWAHKVRGRASRG